MSYNGYTNYETWNVMLHASNFEGLYRLSLECRTYSEYVARCADIGYTETDEREPVSLTDPRIDVAELDEHFIDNYLDYHGEELESNTEEPCEECGALADIEIEYTPLCSRCVRSYVETSARIRG